MNEANRFPQNDPRRGPITVTLTEEGAIRIEEEEFFLPISRTQGPWETHAGVGVDPQGTEEEVRQGWDNILRRALSRLLEAERTDICAQEEAQIL